MSEIKAIQVRPLKKRLIVFSVPWRKKLKSGLYVGNDKRGAFSRCEEIWVVAKGPDVMESFSIGQKCYLSDAFELDDSDFDLWEELQDDPRFKDLKQFVDDCEGTVRTQIVSEWSILAVED